jgi:hypothetical protein
MNYYIPVPTSGTYYLAFECTTIGNSNGTDNGLNSNGPVPGSYYYVEGGASSGCQTPGSGVVISGNLTGENFSFGTSCGEFSGYYGSATFNETGTVSACNPIIIEDFSNSACTSARGGEEFVTTNGGKYNLSEGPGTPAIWLVAFYDAQGTGTYAAGDAAQTISCGTPSGGVTEGFSF